LGSPYVGEIRIFAGNFAPVGWMLCQGQLLPISEYETLFNLIGTTYGGDGQSTFALPNLQSRLPVHQGTSSFGTTYIIGQVAGAETVTLSTPQIPAHSHALGVSSSQGNAPGPAGGVSAASTLDQYATAAPSLAFSPNALSNAGGSQPHDNMSPFLVVNFIISLFGIYPSQT